MYTCVVDFFIQTIKEIQSDIVILATNRRTIPIQGAGHNTNSYTLFQPRCTQALAADTN